MRLARALALLACACSATRTYEADPGPYDRLPDEERTPLETARRAFEAGQLRLAHHSLQGVVERQPANVAVGSFLQDVELARLRDGQALEGIQAPDDPDDALRRLFDLYLARAEERSSSEAYVLAARLAEGSSLALDLLAHAQAIDPRNPWVPYAQAWILYSERRFPEARTALKRAFAIDPGHLPAMRLEATLLASAGDTGRASDALVRWLDRTAGDPLTDPRQRAEAEVDLAALEVLRDEPGAALSVLDGIDPVFLEDPARAELVRAAALDARGESEEALAAARRAHALAPEETLALVQAGLLLAREPGRAAEEAETWRRLLATESVPGAPAPGSADPGVDFRTLLYELQAHTRLERLERAAPPADGAGADG